MEKKSNIRPADIEDQQTACQKAKYLVIISKKGLKVPKTYFCPDNILDLYSKNSELALQKLQAELTGFLDDSKYYSVRFSKTKESDLPISQLTYNSKSIHGIGAITKVIEENLQNTIDNTPRVIRNVAKAKIASQPFCVMVQEVVTTKLSGVVTTINPVSGKNEAIVEACGKTQEFLNKNNPTTHRWIFRRGRCIQRPQNPAQQENIALRVAETAQKISRIIGFPASLEWGFDGKEIFWLQIDKIRAHRPKIYSNKISRELLPGMIKPLVWSINIPVVNSSWKKIFKELTGSAAEGIEIDKLAKPFYFRAYFNMSIVGDFFEMMGISRDALELLFGREKTENSSPIFRPDSRILKHLPRMITFAFRMLFYSKQIEIFLRKKTKQFKSLEELDITLLSIEDCLKQIDNLIVLAKESSFLVIITQLLNAIYNWVLKKNLQKINIDIKTIKYETSQIDCGLHLSQLNSIYRQLPVQKRELIQNTAYQEIINNPDFEIFGKKLEGFLSRFGHLSDNANDFSKTTWKENPKLIIKIIVDYRLSKKNQKNLERTPSQKIAGRTIFQKFLFSRAAKYQRYRELVGFVYNFGFGLFRKFFLRIGEVLSNNDLIESKENIFYLTYGEIKNLVKNPSQQKEIAALINKRKKEMEDCQNLTLPELIFDDLPKSLLIQGKTQKNLTGVATSRGSYVGTARVISGIQDFCKICEGDVLIIPSSDPSWTPLFWKAGAVVSESGGMLSHCSIIAREYGIPAVVSVKGALQIEDGGKVAVDGYKGEVKILKK